MDRLSYNNSVLTYINWKKANKKLKTFKTQRISLSYYDKVKKKYINTFKTYREIFKSFIKYTQKILE